MLPGLGGTIVGLGGASPAAATFAGSSGNSANQTTYTFAGLAIGAASAGRYVVVTTNTTATVTCNAVTVGGVACTELIERTNDATLSIWITDTPIASGTTATVEVTFSGTASNCGVATWAVTGLELTTARDTMSDVGTTLSGTIDVPADGVLIAAASGLTSATWTGATERHETSVEGSLVNLTGASDAFSIAQTNRTVSVVWSSPDAEDIIVAVSLR
jgi:hypothetical protein